DGVHGCNLGLPAYLLYDHIAREHRPDLVFSLKCLVSHSRITRAQNDVGSEVGSDLFFQCALDIDLCQDTKAMILERRDSPLDRLLEGCIQCLGKIVTHRRLRSAALRTYPRYRQSELR